MRTLTTWYLVAPASYTLREIRWLWSVRGSANDTATHFVIGRSSQKPRARLRKMPTDTGSTWIGPTRSSRPGHHRVEDRPLERRPVEKYSSRVIAGEHS